MIYLLLAVLCSALISVIMRISEKYVKSKLGMLAMNYVMCGVLAALYTGPSLGMPMGEGAGMVLVLGVLGGVLYLGGFVLLQWNIHRSGVVLPATFMKLGVLVPTILAVTVFGETPRWTQIVGVAAALAAIVMMQGGRQDAKKGGNVCGLIALLLMGGSSDALSKVYEQIGPQALKDHFLLCIFITAFVLCAALCLLRRQRPSLSDVAFGLLIGVPNYFSSRFLLLSLSEVPAVAAYPSYSVGTIVLITAFGVLLFRERIGRRKMAALGVILAALVLLNV